MTGLARHGLAGSPSALNYIEYKHNRPKYPNDISEYYSIIVTV